MNNYPNYGNSSNANSFNYSDNFYQMSSTRSNHNYLGSSGSSSSALNNLNSNMIGDENNLNEVVIRRNNEIDRLKMKIVLLEERLNSYCSGNGNGNGMSNHRLDYEPMKDETSERIKQLTHDASLLRKEHEMRKNKEAEISKLELILNKREYEFQQLKQKNQEELTKLNNDINKYKALAVQKDEELLNVKSSSSAMQKELEKLQAKWKNCNDYIKSLPSASEVKQTEKQMSDLKSENDSLKSELNENESKYNRAKHFIKDKLNEIKELEEKIESVKASKEKVEIEYQEYRNASQEVGELMERCKENASLKAELDCARKLLSTQQAKLKQMQAKYDENSKDLNQKLIIEEETSSGLRKEVESKEKVITDLHVTINQFINEKQALFDENLTLKDKLNGLETVMNADLKKMLQLLFKELNYCTIDLDELVNNCVDIYSGKQVDLNSLLGTKSTNRNLQDFSIDASNSIVNSEYLMKKTSEIKQLRSKLKQIRAIISDQYAEKIGSNISCITQ